MIRTRSLPQRYTTALSNGRQEVFADAPIEKGGGGAGLGAHELLEAALAVCINMTVRMHADRHKVPLSSVTTRVSIQRPDGHTVRFDYGIELSGPLSAAQREELEAAARACPVRQTLSKHLEFRAMAEQSA
jgi:putative redox protein